MRHPIVGVVSGLMTMVAALGAGPARAEVGAIAAAYVVLGRPRRG